MDRTSRGDAERRKHIPTPSASALILLQHSTAQNTTQATVTRGAYAHVALAPNFAHAHRLKRFSPASHIRVMSGTEPSHHAQPLNLHLTHAHARPMAEITMMSNARTSTHRPWMCSRTGTPVTSRRELHISALLRMTPLRHGVAKGHNTRCEREASGLSHSLASSKRCRNASSLLQPLWRTQRTRPPLAVSRGNRAKACRQQQHQGHAEHTHHQSQGTWHDGANYAEGQSNGLNAQSSV